MAKEKSKVAPVQDDRTTEKRKVIIRDQWVDYYKDFGILKKDREFNPVEDETAIRIVQYGVDVSNVKLMHKGDWIHLAELWIVAIIALFGNLENSHEAITAVESIILIVVVWAIIDIVGEYNSAYITAEYNIPSAVNKFTDKTFATEASKKMNGEFVLISQTNAADYIKKIEKQLSIDLIKKLIIVLLMLFVSAFIVIGYLITWNSLYALLFGLIGIPSAVISAILIDRCTYYYRRAKAKKKREK